MIEAITKERWQEAQIAERAQHSLGLQEGYTHYYESYKKVFKFLGIELDQQGKTIMEVGPADFPALAYCYNYKGIIIEPMPSGHLETICLTRDIKITQTTVEETSLPNVDACWLFNVLQHVIDPELLVEKCKEAARVICFFEPIDYPTAPYHPHTFSQDDFIRWFGNAERYKGGSEPGFHEADCAYGVWRK